jgi:hypothetical protein
MPFPEDCTSQIGSNDGWVSKTFMLITISRLARDRYRLGRPRDSVSDWSCLVETWRRTIAPDGINVHPG